MVIWDVRRFVEGVKRSSVLRLDYGARNGVFHRVCFGAGRYVCVFEVMLAEVFGLSVAMALGYVDTRYLHLSIGGKSRARRHKASGAAISIS